MSMVQAQIILSFLQFESVIEIFQLYLGLEVSTY